MKLVMLAPGTDKDGKPLAPGQEIDVDDETGNLLRLEGKAAVPYDPKAQQEGVYTARAGREGAPSPPPVSQPEPINAPAKDDEPKKK